MAGIAPRPLDLVDVDSRDFGRDDPWPATASRRATLGLTTAAEGAVEANRGARLGAWVIRPVPMSLGGACAAVAAATMLAATWDVAMRGAATMDAERMDVARRAEGKRCAATTRNRHPLQRTQPRLGAARWRARALPPSASAHGRSPPSMRMRAAAQARGHARRLLQSRSATAR